VRPPALLLLALGAAVLSPVALGAPQTPLPPTLRILGFSPHLSPGGSQTCRQAVAHAVDRDAVAAAAAPHLPQKPFAAVSIQHPTVPGYIPGAPVYPYDPARARELYRECGYGGTLRISIWTTTAGAMQVSVDAVAESLRRNLGAAVAFSRVASLDLLLFAARTGSVPMWILDWVAHPSTVGYPSFALGIGATLVGDPDVRALVAKGDVRGAEALMLQRALLVPLIYY